MIDRSPVKIKHVDHIAATETVNEITDDTGVKQGLGKIENGKLRIENFPALPYEDGERKNAENGERPDLTLEEPPRAPAVLDIRKIEKTRNDGTRRGSLEDTRSEFLGDGIDENKVRNDGKNRQKLPHFEERSISF